MKLLAAPFRLLIDNGTEAARAVSAAYEAAELQLPPLPSQLAASCAFWLLLCAAAVVTLLLLLLRAYLDGGGVIPLSSRCVCPVMPKREQPAPGAPAPLRRARARHRAETRRRQAQRAREACFAVRKRASVALKFAACSLHLS